MVAMVWLVFLRWPQTVVRPRLSLQYRSAVILKFILKFNFTFSFLDQNVGIQLGDKKNFFNLYILKCY